jgi:hypothetical protein
MVKGVIYPGDQTCPVGIPDLSDGALNQTCPAGRPDLSGVKGIFQKGIGT